MQRYWLLQERIVTSQELKRAGVSPLRAVDLGRCATVEVACDKAARRVIRSAALVIAHNVRLVGDSGHGARFGVSAEQIEALRRGEHLTVTDSAGTFHIGYDLLEDSDEN